MTPLFSGSFLSSDVTENPLLKPMIHLWGHRSPHHPSSCQIQRIGTQDSSQAGSSWRHTWIPWLVSGIRWTTASCRDLGTWPNMTGGISNLGYPKNQHRNIRHYGKWLISFRQTVAFTGPIWYQQLPVYFYHVWRPQNHKFRHFIVLSIFFQTTLRLFFRSHALLVYWFLVTWYFSELSTTTCRHDLHEWHLILHFLLPWPPSFTNPFLTPQWLFLGTNFWLRSGIRLASLR